MKVALYTSQLAPEGPSGVHRYVAEIGRALFDLHPNRYQMLCSAEDAPPAWLPSGMPIVRLPGPRRALHLLWLLVKRPKIDRWARGAQLLHVLHPTFPVPSKVPCVWTFHDALLPFSHPEWYQRETASLFRAAARDAAHRAVRVIAVSHYVAAALTDRLSIEPSRISVIPSGIGEHFKANPSPQRVKEACARFGVEPKQFFLYVGAVSAGKNVITLVRAMAQRGPGAPLLVAGPNWIGTEGVIAEIDRFGLEHDVIMVGHVDADLPALLAGALALVFPSEDEGFGFPPLEAMSVGTPAIVSRAGALPEVLGGAPMFLDAHDVDAWAEAMTRVEADHAFAEALSEKGRLQASAYSWERTARETAAVHESVLGLSD